MVISHCWLQDGFGAEWEMIHNKMPGSPMWPLKCSVQDSSSFKTGAFKRQLHYPKSATLGKW